MTTLRLDPSTKAVGGGRVLVGGAPLRVIRLSATGARLFAAWCDGEPVGDKPHHRRLADKLILAGMVHPAYDDAKLTPQDVTVVVPVRDHADRLAGLLPHLAEVRETLVVDDGSAVPVPHAVDRHPVPRGPAAARNTGWRKVTTELVAFLDADTRPEPGWLEPLLAQFEDPAVVAVAPRVRSEPGAGTLSRYERLRSSLDMGPVPAQVRPRGRITYLPTAALVVRTSALQAIHGFDEELRFGEDVDLIWRLVDAGGSVRYEPRSEVVHAPRSTWRGWLQQRYSYGTSAGPLARRHGRKALAPVRVSGWTALAWLAIAAGRPKTGAAIALATAALLPRKLKPLDVPAEEALGIALRGHVAAGRFLADALTGAWGPVAVPLLALSRRGRRVLALAYARHLLDWARTRPDVGPARWLLARAADDLAYGAGVWRGCLAERQAGPLIPDLANWPARRPPAPSTEALRGADSIRKRR
ncbi:mycofactocin biosynthesis glycosyltransferase MftF [Amycolatopsis thermophila]|uniref:Mycofactocin system glycosyltransferase n=1 Tax=Amycolatopsis thermophila TaxID=206084 RepID=A0ABU0EXN6_9PSEU|nr:mycofactocin biosynthesis glycosyltransferase MftF [Amycolatopsis thermophila]MDQ0380072.1 mycofactocin system glycosyltransferase [Amycolatopsis thermophila]